VPGSPGVQTGQERPGVSGAAPRVSYSGPLPAWVNEIHYDNTGTDEGEVRLGTIQCITVHYRTVQYCTPQGSAVHYSTVQYSKV